MKRILPSLTVILLLAGLCACGAAEPIRGYAEPAPRRQDRAAALARSYALESAKALAAKGAREVPPAAAFSLSPAGAPEAESPSSRPEEPEEGEALVHLGKYYITGYDICQSCCGKTDGITASGAAASVGRTIAAGKEFPFGTVLYIEGIGERVVEDRGVKNGCVDVLCNNHSECYDITGWRDVYIKETRE